MEIDDKEMEQALLAMTPMQRSNFVRRGIGKRLQGVAWCRLLAFYVDLSFDRHLEPLAQENHASIGFARGSCAPRGSRY